MGKGSATFLAVLVVAFALTVFAKDDVIDVPFEFYRDSVIVQVKVNEKGPFNMLLDTGVNPSVIDRQAAKKIGLKLSAKGSQGSGSGSETNLAYETSLPNLEVSGLRASDVAALAINLKK